MSSLFRPFSTDYLRRLLAAQTGDFVLLETTKGLADNHLSWLFQQPKQHLRCTVEQWPRFWERCEDVLAQGFYLAGWFAYEFGYFLEPALKKLRDLPADLLLADLGVFSRPVCFDHELGQWLGPEPDLRSQALAGPVTVGSASLSLSREQYLPLIHQIKDYIKAGDTYQVNYTLKLFFDFQGDGIDLYLKLRANQGVGYGAYIRQADQQILSLSPELFFAKDGRHCTVRPMKGTMQRGRTPAEDQERIDFLRHDAKNRSENVMIVDLLRNDLGRLAKAGTVHTRSLFDVESYESLHQMTSTITAQLPEKLSLAQLFTALFPCGSVTGAPKIRTMEIIHELEHKPRGVYTGAIGYLAPTGAACFNVPIRTVVLNEGRGEMGIGSGIVADSDPEEEWRECLLKADFFRHGQEFALIETMLWQPDSGYWLLEQHLERLLASARHFNFQLPYQQLSQQLADFAQDMAAVPQRVRLLLDKEGKCQLSTTSCQSPIATTLAQASHLKPEARCTLASETVSSSDIFLYHKTTKRDLFNHCWQLAEQQGDIDMLFVNELGQVTQGAISNLFIKRQGEFITPPLTSGLLPGVLRQHLLASEGDHLKEEPLTVADLLAAEAIFLGNSVRGLVAVRLAV